MCASVEDADQRDALKKEVLDRRAWEEPVLFACERMARGVEAKRKACASAILSAFDVDPILAAEMIYRSTDDVWNSVKETIMELVLRWHEPGHVDPAVHFMITSGREEFRDFVWPLITDEDTQVHLKALRAGTRFRPSILGSDAASRIAAVAPALRRTLVSEMAYYGGMDGLDLVALVAKSDPGSETKAAAVRALAFCGADRHVVDVLHEAEDAVFDQLVHTRLIHHITDEVVKARLTAARERRVAQGIGPHERISALRFGPAARDKEEEVTAAIAEVEIEEPTRGVVDLIHELKEHYPSAVANGMLQRVREGRKLPWHAIELIAGAEFALEEEDLLDIALSEDQYDQRAEAATSVLGPQAVGRLIDRMLELREQLLTNDARDEKVFERHRTIERRTEFARTEHVLAAIAPRSMRADCQTLSDFAGIIHRQGDGAHRHGRAFDDDAKAQIAGFVQDWGIRFLGAPEATREELASVAALARHGASPDLLPVLERLLDEELARRKSLAEQARALNYRDHPVTHASRMCWTHWYQGAFLAMRYPETAKLMEKYLLDEEFGHLAIVLAEQWRAAHEPRDDERRTNRPDFSRVAQIRDARRRDPEASSAEADVIFGAVEQLIGTHATEDEKKHAVALGTVAAALPHGERDDILSTLIGIADVAP